MSRLKFKTNINCASCIANVTPYLEEVDNIESWQVDTTSKDKILTVVGDDVKAGEVEKAVKSAGYKIDQVRVSVFSKFFSLL